MKTTFLNAKTSEGIETIDELNKGDFKTIKEFKQELKRLIQEYKLIGLNIYPSSRACKNWK